jgi:Sulfatase
MRRAFLVALSFANLCYLRVWSELLTYTRWDTYLMTTPPKPVEYIALAANVLLIAVVLTGLSLLARRVLPGKQFRFAEMALVVGICIPLNALRAVLSNRYPLLKSPLIELLGMRGVMILGVCLAIVGLITVVFFHHRVAGAIVAVLAALSPFCAVTFGQAAWKATHYDDSAFRNKTPAARTASTGKLPRVLWVIADEWDYRLTFVDRNPGLMLPEIDRLRATSLYADHAYPPGPETPISIPGYYSGRLVEHVRHDGPRELLVAYHGDSRGDARGDSRGEVPWSAQPSVFDGARALGANTALLEWYHPTCRVLNSLTYCDWWPMAMQHNSMGEGFWQILPNQTRSLFESNILSLFGRSLTAEQQAGVYHAMMREAEKLSVDPDFAFTLVHLPVPHAPHAYNRKTGTFTLGNSPITGYIDSLALLDRTVGELRRTMEKAGVWDTTTVLFTSDHGLRDSEALDGKTDGRIPFLLKVASQKEAVPYTQQFDTVLTADMLLGVLRGEIRDPASAAAWLDQARTRPLGNEKAR